MYGKNLKQINLMLGTACDRHCDYCLQYSDNTVANKKANIDEFVSKLVNILPKEYSIAMWGGEPMVYFDKIKRIVELLKKYNKIPKRIGITTHGRTLTEEYVDFANVNKNVWTAVSCHGYDFTDDQLDRIFKLENFSFSELIYHGQVNTDHARDFTYRLMDKYEIFPHVWLHFVKATDHCDKSFYLTREDVDELCDHLIKDVFPRATLGDIYSQWLLNQLQREQIQRASKSKGAMCVNQDTLSVDLHGNIYNCHHNYDSSNIVGNILKKIIPIYSGNNVPLKYFLSKECQSCECLNECRGGCYMSNNHEIDCYLQKRLYKVLEPVKKGYRCCYEWFV